MGLYERTYDLEKTTFEFENVKKILVVSDSHSNNRNLFRVMEKLENYMDLMIHLGDMECDPNMIYNHTKKPVVFVKGNCDRISLPKNAIIKIGEHVIYATHGTNFNGEYSLWNMQETALMNGADVIMVGHTHIPLLDEDKEMNVAVVNPGSISRPRQFPSVPTYLVINVRDDGSFEYVPCKL